MAAGIGTASYNPSPPSKTKTPQPLPFKPVNPQELSNRTYVQLLMEMHTAGMVTTNELRFEVEKFYLYNPVPPMFHTT